MLLEPELSAIELTVADLKFNETVLRQQARPSELTIRLLPNGCCELVLTMQRQAFGVAVDGGLGDAVPAAFIADSSPRQRLN